MKSLTSRQEETLKFLTGYQAEKGFPPTVREIAEHFGIYPRAVADHLRSLERKGCIKIHPGKNRGIETVVTPPFSPNTIPVFGRIPAGEPFLVFENVEEVLKIDPKFFSTGRCFAVRVQGDSMIGAHIKHGDYVILRKQDDAQDGEIVAALLGEEVTLKRLRKRKGEILLVPENPAYKQITFRDNPPVILGVLVGVIRKV